MIVTIDQFRRGLVSYIDVEVGQHVTGLTKFGVYFALPVITANFDKTVEQFRSTPLADGFFDENGNIDLDALHSRAVDAMRRCDNVEFGGMRFRENDINALRDHIERA